VEEPPDNKINKLLIVLRKKTQQLALVLLCKVSDLRLTFFVNLSKVPVSFFPVGLVVEEEPPDNKINKLLIVLGEKRTQRLAIVLL